MDNKITQEEYYWSIIETKKHIDEVRKRLIVVAKKLLDRAMEHDKSKLGAEEAESFAQATKILGDLQYGSEEYEKAKLKLGTALEHHYQHNRHHPEFFKNGITEMNLLDVIEMFCDWKAATLRHKTGDIHKSIEINAPKYGIDPVFASILKNTVNEIEPE